MPNKYSRGSRSLSRLFSKEELPSSLIQVSFTCKCGRMARLVVDTYMLPYSTEGQDYPVTCETCGRYNLNFRELKPGEL